MTIESENAVAGIFDDVAAWHYPSPELNKREGVAPNQLAYCKANATLALIVLRSVKGRDFALGEKGLLYLEAALNKGTLMNGAPVRAVFVVLADPDLSSPRKMRLVSCWSALETRNRVNGLPLCSGNFGRYWWVTADALEPEDAAFLNMQQQNEQPL
jgi:hypothetical protein